MWVKSAGYARLGYCGGGYYEIGGLRAPCPGGNNDVGSRPVATAVVGFLFVFGGALLRSRQAATLRRFCASSGAAVFRFVGRDVGRYDRCLMGVEAVCFPADDVGLDVVGYFVAVAGASDDVVVVAGLPGEFDAGTAGVAGDV